MKLEDLNMGAVIMHADARTNPIHTGTMYIVLKIDIEREDIEACCVNCQNGTAIGEVRHISTSSISEYNMLFQILIAPTAVASNTTAPSKDLYLRWAFGKKTSLGRVGDKTPYKLKNGRNLVVGDTVTIENDRMKKTGCLVVYDEDDGYYIMGISSLCNSKTGEIKNFTVSLEKSFSGVKNGDTFSITSLCDCIEVVDFIPNQR